MVVAFPGGRTPRYRRRIGRSWSAGIGGGRAGALSIIDVLAPVRGGAVSRQGMGSQQRGAHAGEAEVADRGGQHLRAFGQGLREGDKDDPGHQGDACRARQDLGSDHRDAEANPGDTMTAPWMVIHGCRSWLSAV